MTFFRFITKDGGIPPLPLYSTVGLFAPSFFEGFDLFTQGIAMDADRLGGSGDIPVIQTQSFLNELLFKLRCGFIQKDAFVEHFRN
jgi:hypothetical protein